MTYEERSRAMRADLKAAGITSRQVSVRHHDAGYSDAWRVTVNDPNVSVMQVKEICRKYSSVDYDERTGEILEGANSYIHVQRGFEHPADGSRYLEAVNKALSALERDGQGVKIEGTSWTLFKDGIEYRGFSKEEEEIDRASGRFSVIGYHGVAEAIAGVLKERELDSAYLKQKKELELQQEKKESSSDPLSENYVSAKREPKRESAENESAMSL